LGFDHIKEIYKDDLDFSLIFQECPKGGLKEFFIHDDFLFKGKRLCDENQIKEAFINEGRGHSPSHLKFFLLVFSKLKEDIK